MYTKLPLGFNFIFVKSEIIDYINENQSNLLNRTILSNAFTNNEHSFSVHAIFKNKDKHNSLFVCMLASYKVLHSMQGNANIYLEWPNKLTVNSNLVAKCEIQTFSEITSIKISMKRFCNTKDTLIKLCEQLNGQIYELKMLGEKHIMQQINNLIQKEKKHYSKNNNKISIKIDSIADNGNLQIIANTYKKHSLVLDDFLCIKELKP